MSLEFGKIDNTIGVHDSLRDQVLVDPVTVVQPQLVSVIFGTVQEMTQIGLGKYWFFQVTILQFKIVK